MALAHAAGTTGNAGMALFSARFQGWYISPRLLWRYSAQTR
jgi:hypothetical protein